MSMEWGQKTGLFLSIISFFLLTLCSEAQIENQQSITSYSSSGNLEGIIIRQTVGQPYYTGVFYGNKMNIRPGFQQPSFYGREKVNSKDLVRSKIDIFPNPAAYSVNIYSQEVMEQPFIKITDISGKIVVSEYVDQLQSYSVNCETWDNGIYIVNILTGTERISLKLIINR